MAWSVRKMGDTRRERESKVVKTFGPLYALVDQLLADAVDSIRGEPVLLAWGEYMSAAHTLEAFGGCLQRIAPDRDLSIYARVAKKLHNGIPVPLAEAQQLRKTMQECEAVYRATPMSELREAIVVVQLQIEVEELGLAA